MTASILLAIISVLIILEGLFVAVFPKKTKRLTNKFFKNPKKIKTIGLIELLIGIALFVLSLSLR
tara:strand:- start:223 stop:417 length:195 start_codon:yes stop_codon:yes gene_type:complete